MRGKALAVYIILGLLIVQVNGAYESQTIHIADDEDDGFVTESGSKIDGADLLYTTEASQDIHTFWVFHDVHVENTEKLNNATLAIRGASTMDFDADNSFTLYGIELSDFQNNWPALGGMLIVYPITTSYVNVNTSNWYGPTWFEIDVTNIVRELINHPSWDGDASGTGDSIGFVGKSTADDTRYFYDYNGAVVYSANLFINWGDPPSPPPPEDLPPDYNETVWEFVNETVTVVINETSGDTDTIDIFTSTDYGDVEFQFMGVDDTGDLWYQNSSKGVGGEVEIPGSVYRTDSGAIDPIISLDPWVFMIADNGSTEIYFTDDEFLTWNTSEVNAQYPTLDPFAGNYGSLALDPDGVTIHVVWSSVTPWENAVYNVLYTNFTFNPVTRSLDWALDFVNITIVGATQYEPVLYCQNNGTLHIVWSGHQGTAHDQVYYRRREANGTWLAQVRISDTDALDHWRPDVVANEDTGDALVVWSYDSIGLEDLYWDIVFANNTDGPDRVFDADGGFPAMVNDRANNVAQVVFQDTGLNPKIEFTTKVIDNATAWGAKTDVSPGGEKHLTPDIGLESDNGTIVVIWRNDWNPWTAYNTWQIGDAPVSAKLRITTLQIRNIYIEDEFDLAIVNQTYWLVWGNGTVIDGPFDTLDDARDGLDGIVDPDPEDPDPPGSNYPQTGPFTRFSTRFYILILGIGCFVGPVLFFASKKGSLTGYYIGGGLIVMLMGLGLMLAIRQI